MPGYTILAALALVQAEPGVIPPVTPERADALTARFEALTVEHHLVTAGVGIIRDGELVWTGYFGEQSPGVPASRDTMFDVASITKTVTAETILRLVEEGRISLDEPMSPFWVDPDIADDPRHERLTPRMALTHATGFPNWRFFLPDGQLAFVREPGTGFGYSGEGLEYVARFAAIKLETPFPELVNQAVFAPLGLDHAMLEVDPERFDEIVRAVDEEGRFYGHFCRPQSGWCREAGTYSAADDLRISVEDHARFLISVMQHEGYDAALAVERDRIQTPTGEQAPVDCSDPEIAVCPQAQGYGLGWQVVEYEDGRLLFHGGSDWSEMALAYFYEPSQDGAIIFFNTPNAYGPAAMAEALEAIDPNSPLIGLYRRRAAGR